MFDKDGTLFDVNTTWSVYCERIIDALAPDDPTLRQALAQTCGYNTSTHRLEPSSVVIAGAAHELTTALHTALTGWSHAAVDRIARDSLIGLPVKPLTDLSRLLERLRQMGLRLGVATNDFRAGAVLQLSEAGLADAFDFVCGSDCGFGAKPSPAMIEAFASHIGCATSEVVMVGDSIHDVKAGFAAGCACVVAVATGYQTLADLRRLTPSVLSTLDDLPDLLQRVR